MKPITNIWDYFLAFDENGVQLSGGDVTKAKKVKCKACDWDRVPNASRMKKHIAESHGNVPDGCPDEPVLPSPDAIPASQMEIVPPPPKKQRAIETFMDPGFFLCNPWWAE